MKHYVLIKYNHGFLSEYMLDYIREVFKKIEQLENIYQCQIHTNCIARDINRVLGFRWCVKHHLDLRNRYPGTLQCLSPTYRSGSLSTVSHRINMDLMLEIHLKDEDALKSYLENDLHIEFAETMKAFVASKVSFDCM